MRNFFTQLFLIVLMVTLYSTSAYAITPPNTPAADLWPDDNSTTQLQPGSQTITLTFPATTNANTIWRLRSGGIISLNSATFGGGGTFQQETLQYGTDPGIVLVGSNQIQVTFQHLYVEDDYYYVTVSNDLIQLVDGSLYSGLSVGPNPTVWSDPDWSFQIDDITNPTLVLCDPEDIGDDWIHNGQYGVPVVEDTVYVCFDEPVYWANGVNPDNLRSGQIAFYHATNEDLRLPAGEFGGDVLYEEPFDVTLLTYPTYPEEGGGWHGYTTLKIVVKDTALIEGNATGSSSLKYAAIGDSVWPVDADIYLRLASGLLVDRGGNPFLGINGSPWDSNIGGTEYWFSTRDDEVIHPDIFAVNNNGTSDNSRGTVGNPLWDNDDFVVTFDQTGLVLADNLSKGSGSWTTTDIQQFIHIARTGGIGVSFSLDNLWEDGGYTYIRLEPNTLVTGATYTITVDAEEVADADLALNIAREEPFVAGDFNAPVIAVELYNTLCTNFDIRVMSDENAWVYYAILNTDSIPGDLGTPTYQDIMRGYRVIDRASPTPDKTVYFNHVEDPFGGPYVYGYGAPTVFSPDSFMAQPLLAAYEHIDDFIAANHGETFKVFYFAVDSVAEGPYATALTNAGLQGRATAVGNLTVTLDDCLEPEQEWHSEGTANETPSNPLFDLCGQGENIRRQGRWLLKTPAGGYTEPMVLTNPSGTWMDVLHLYVDQDSLGTWTEVEILSAVPNGANTEVMVTPKNSYPSGWYARIVLESGAVEDASGNVINYELICSRRVETYDDPLISRFTVQTVDATACYAPETLLNGVAAKRDGKIIIKFNNPMFIPQRDEPVANTLVPFSMDPDTSIWIGNYIKIREGNDVDASITSDIWANEPVFWFAPKSNGGVDSVVITPPVWYDSETWYYVEVDTGMQDENRVVIDVDDNNTFLDPHHLYANNLGNYFIKFKTEDTTNPELIWLFNIVLANDPDVTRLYSDTPDSVDVSNVSPWGQWDGTAYNDVPVAARINEWSEMGFDSNEGYDPNDANSLRQYFSMTDALGNPMLFDMVVLDSSAPEDEDYVVFGFIPFTALAEGSLYHMAFDPMYSAEGVDYEGHAWAEGPVFIDCNGNPVLKDMNVAFTTWLSTMPTCLDFNIAVVGDTTPDVVLTFTNLLPTTNLDTTPLAQVPAGFWAQISGGSQTFEVNDTIPLTADFTFVGNTVTIPWEMFEKMTGGGSNNALLANTDYTVTIPADAFLDRNSYMDTMRSCENEFEFSTADLSAPVIAYLSPDEINPLPPFGSGTDEPALYPGTVNNVRANDSLVIAFNEPVWAVNGKFVELWENGTTRRDTFYIQQATKIGDRTFKWTIPGDFLSCDSRYHVDVQAGLVEDASEIGNPRMTGSAADDDSTWTFITTDYDEDIAVTGVTPTGVIDPYSVPGYVLNAAQDSVKISTLSVTLSQAAAKVPGKVIAVQNTSTGGADLLSVDVNLLSSTNGVTWTYTIPGGLWVPYNDDVQIIVPRGAFVETGGCGDLDSTMSGGGAFEFLDEVEPFATLWPEDGDEHVAFNSHLYAKFSERVIGYDATPVAPYTDLLMLDVANLKSWVKLWKNDGSWVQMDYDQYVVEFVNLERTHIRITPLDEDAPGFNGVTASMEDEMEYRLQILTTGVDGEGAGYTLRDLRENTLESDEAVEFTTEDITPPTLSVACGTTPTPTGFDVTFTSNEGYSVVYWAWFNEASTPTAANLFSLGYETSRKDTLSSGGTLTKTMTVPNPPGTDYDYYVYAVVADDEIDVFVPTTFGDAWVVSDPVFIASGDCNPVSPYLAVGIRDIRPAPNKNNEVKDCNSNVCDDDKPIAESKQWHTSQIVPTDATFIIDFNENVISEYTLQEDDYFADPDIWAKEIRLRKWENNVSIPIMVQVVNGDSIRITPVTAWGGSTPQALDPETKYYIEIDRFAIRDIVDCGTTPDNYFAGWVGKTDWWFATNDEVPPRLVSVTPTGHCVEKGNNSISFTFKEGNVNGVKTKVNTTNPFRNNIYIYKAAAYPDGEPYEIIYAHNSNGTPKVATHPSDSTYVLTYNTTHFYGSEECYVVQWDSTLFVDGSPNANVYIEDAVAVTGAIVPVPSASEWDKFEFCTRDYMKPVIHWAVVNTWWRSMDPSYVYPVYGTDNVIAAGTFDANDPEYTSGSQTVDINVCGDNLVPNKLGFYVWTDEQVTHAAGHATRDLFALRVAGTSNGVTLEVDSTSYRSSPVVPDLSSKTMAGGVVVNNIWYSVSPANSGDTLLGDTRYEFRIIPNEIRDTNSFNCTENANDGDILFNFCTWNSDPARATLTDACSEEINTLKLGLDSIKPWVADTCVCEGAYFDLCFDKIVVKSVGPATPPVGVPGAPWFTWANLLMNEADLMATNNGNYIDFREKGVSGADGAVVIDSVQIFVNGVEMSSGQPCSCAAGPLCYRLWVHGELDENTRYVLTLQDSVLKDQVRIPNGNLFPGQTWEFETRWDTNPTIESISPYDGEETVIPSRDLIIGFNRAVVGGEGHIIVRDNGQPSGVVLNYVGTDTTHVKISGSTVTIKHPMFTDNTTFYVEILDNFVYGKDCDGMPYIGEIEQGLIEDDWDFSTGDVDGPVASLYPNQNPDDYTADCVPPITPLILTFDENIDWDTDCGELVIYRAVSLNPNGSPEGDIAGGAVYGDVVQRIALEEGNFPQVIVAGTNPANGLTANQIYVIPSIAFVSGETYYIRVEGNGVDCDSETNILSDVMGNPWHYPTTSPLPGVHYNDWWFKIADDSAPELISMSPDREEVLEASQLGEGVTTDITMTFDMDVLVGAGNIQIWEFIVAPEGGVANQEEHLWAEFDVQEAVTSGKITIDGAVVTIHDVMLLDGIDWYYVLAEPGTFTSTVPCILKQWLGITNPDWWLFSTEADDTCPVLTEADVDSDADDVTYEEPTSVNFELIFSENIGILYGSQEAYILDENEEVVAEATIDAANVDGNVVTLSIADFDAPLADQSSYFLSIPTHSLTDMATNSTHNMLWPVPGVPGAFFGNVPAGNENFLCENILIPFETGDFTAPEVVDFSPIVTCLGNEVVIAAEFSEAVLDGDGFIHLVDAEGILDDVVLDAADDEDPAANAVAFTVTLPDETDWYVIVDAGFVTDVVYSGSIDGPLDNVAIDDAATWTFGIDDNTVPSLVSWAVVGQDIDNLETSFDIVLTYDDIITSVDVAEAQLMLEGNPFNGVDGAVLGPNDDQVTVSIDSVADQSVYTLVLGAGFVNDDACNANGSLAIEVDDEFVVGDRTKPIVEDWDPTGIQPTYIGIEVLADFFDDSDLTVEGPIYITNFNNDDEVISQIEWTPVLDAEQSDTAKPALWFGYVEVRIPAGTVADENGNVNDEFTWIFFITDNVAPDDECLLSISPDDGEEGVLSQPNLVMEFCERMAACATTQYVNVYELNSTGTNVAVAQIRVTDEMIDGTTVTIPLDEVTIMPSYNTARPGTLKDNQDYIIMADAGSICDEAGNPWVGISTPIRWNWTTGDNTAPTVVLVPDGSTNDGRTIVVEAQFSEEVVGATTLITVTGATSSTIVMNGDNDVATITMVAADLATVVINVPTTITDVADEKGYGNPLAVAVSGTYHVGDNTSPIVSYTAPADPQLNIFAVELSFDEPVQGVEEALTITGGTWVIDGVDGDEDYTVTITAVDEAPITFVLATSVTDISINENPLLTGLDLDFNVGDHVAPTYTVAPVTLADADNTFTVAIAFSEEVEGVEEGITVAGATSSTLVPAAEANTWTLSVTAPDLAEITVSVAASITDGAPNFNPVVADEFEYTIGDNTHPTVSVYKPTATDTVNVFDVIITFSEPVTGASTSSITIDGHAASMELRTIIAGLAYEATLTGADGDTLTLSFSDAIADLAGNELAPVSFVYTIADTKAPTVVATPATGVNLENSNSVTLKFSEDVVGAQTGITVAGATVSNVTYSDSVAVVTYTALDKATVTITVTSAVEDWKGNAIVPVTFTYSIDDNTAPAILSVSPESEDLAANSFDVVVSFTEPVWGAKAGITVAGANSFSVAGADGAAVYTVTINGDDWDEVTMTIPATIVDGAGNPNTIVAGGVYEYTIGDNTAPTVIVTGPAAPIPATFQVTLQFNEPVQGVVGGVVGGTAVKVDDDTYTVTITGAEKATVNLTLPATITDMYGNALAPQTIPYTIGDFTKPTATVNPATLAAAKNSFNVTITFDEDVTGLASAITVAGGTMTTPVVEGNTATVTLGGVDGATVTMMIASTVADLAGNTYAGGMFTYVIGDNTAPTLTVEAEDDPQATTFDVTLIFNEPVQGVKTAGVLRAVGGTITNITGADGDTEYVVTITGAEMADVILQVSTLVKDIAGNKFAGVNLAFEIGDFTAPVATAMSPTGELLVDDTTFDIVLTLSEDVVAGTGTMVVYKGAVPVATFNASAVTIVGNTVSAPVSLDKQSDYWVYVTPGFVKDAAGNAFAGITLPSVWTFKTKNFAVVDPIIENIQFKVYPNPFNDYIFIDNADKLNRVVISNIAGQSVIDVMYPGREVRTPNLARGIYVITLFTEDGIAKTERIVKR